MLPKKQRLTRNEFDQVFKDGKRLHTPIAQLIYKQSDTFHASAVVGKKVYKKAVDRNTLRRRLYGLLYGLKHAAPGMTYILIAKPPIAKLARKAMREEIQTLLGKVPRL